MPTLKMYCKISVNSSQVVRLLIDEGAKLDVIDFKGNMPLYWACENESFEMVKMLIDAGAEVDPPLGHCCKETPIKCASRLELT